jgi:anti-sigma regulatory factor (Ser/Thr protein kinase)
VADASGRFDLRIPRDMSGLARLGDWVDKVVATLALDAKAEYAVRLCVEEAVANVVMHGVPAGSTEAGTVTLRVHADAEALRIAVEDHCAAFDPSHVAPPEHPSNLAEAREGGLGIHLMRQYARSIDYARLEGTNRLTVTIARH